MTVSHSLLTRWHEKTVWIAKSSSRFEAAGEHFRRETMLSSSSGMAKTWVDAGGVSLVDILQFFGEKAALMLSR